MPYSRFIDLQTANGSMTGPLIAHETLLHCIECKRIYSSEEFRRLVAFRCTIAWDVVVFIGRSLFERHRSVEEVRAEMASRNAYLCPSHITYLGGKFIVSLAHAHREATPRIEESMRRNGGYILHLDALHDSDAPALMSGIDELSHIVLANVKIPTEHADYIIPFLEGIRARFGGPIACAHDMGKGICKAVGKVFPQSRDFICHFHFLRDVGKDFIEPAYSQLRKLLRHHCLSSALAALARDVRSQLGSQSARCARLAKAIESGQAPEDLPLLPLFSTYTLALWCLQGKRTGDGYGFPFDRPLLAFADRILVLIDQLPELLQRLPPSDKRANRNFVTLARKVLAIGAEPAFEHIIEELRWRCRFFDDLRNAMRIAPAGGTHGLNDDGTTKAMNRIRTAVEQFRNRLETQRRPATDDLCRGMAQQIDKYGEKLFADPIALQTPSGIVLIYPQRTNNIIERFFRLLRRDHRRKIDNNSMRRSLQAMLADTPLIQNLKNSSYMEILLNGTSTLEELFASLETTADTNSMLREDRAGTDRILPGCRSLIRMETLPAQVASALMAA